MAEQQCHISILKLFASGNGGEWLKCFEICSKANKKAKALQVPTLLEGVGLATWMELNEDEQGD